jgi:hypothetical protein
MFENIPAELRAMPQWVAAGPDKKPINPRTGQLADPSNPATGGTFAQAVHCGMKHVGFILGHDDPFTIIDLDDPFERITRKIVDGVSISVKSPIKEGDPDFSEACERAARHTKIYESFNTYAEESQSGRGLHLVMQGKIPCGVRRDKVEIYSIERYMIFTGKVLRNAPVANCQELLDGMFAQMGKLTDEAGELIEEDPVKEDSEIWQIATRASNAEKFIKLCEGQWEELGQYPSQSEADYAMISMLAFYTRSNEQVRRMFRQTKLANRPKATRNDTYIDRSLKRIRAREAPLVDVSKLPLVQAELPGMEEALTVPEAEEMELEISPFSKEYTFPPGLVGEVASYILSSAIRPVPEVALAGAIALCAGVAARSYNIPGSGLNQYIMLLAKTGRGKEGAASGIDNLIAAVRQNIPMVDEFMGPAAFASGQALVKVLDSRPCFVSVLGEFGLTLQQICDPQAPGPLVMLKRVLLDIYAKSGFTKILHSSVYSDSEKNTRRIQGPNVTILGESTPHTFFNGLDISNIAEGLISRFSIIEYIGGRPAKNPNAFHPPTPELVKSFGDFATIAINTKQNYTCCPVGFEPEAKRAFDMLCREADNHINDSQLEVESELWNRADLKALKLGALVAFGINPHAPTVSLEVAEWACAFVRREISAVMSRFKSGEVGNGEEKQESEVKRLFQHFQTLSKPQRKAHRCPPGLMDSAVCPITFFTVYSRRLSCFKTDRRGAARALSETLADMVKREVLEMIPLQQLQTEFKTKAAIYYPGPAW